MSFCFTCELKPCSPTIVIPARIPQQTITCSETAIETPKKKRSEICSKLTIKTPERRHFTLFSSISIVDFEQANVNWIST